MQSLATHRPSSGSKGWTLLGSVVLGGLMLVAFLMWGNWAGAVPSASAPDALAAPSLAASHPALLASTAQITPGACPLDVAVVFDVSGSMEYTTICYDCWVRTDDTNPDYPNNGYFNPIPSDVVSSQVCSDTQVPHEEETYRYLIAEAELAAFNPPLWQTRYRQTGQGYWAIQRGSRNGEYDNRSGDPSRQSSNPCLVPDIDCAVPGDPSDDLCHDDPLDGNDVFVDCSAYISHHPWATYYRGAPPAAQMGMFYYLEDVIDSDPQPPRLEYDFTPVWTDTAHIWIRAQGGGARAYEPIYQDPFILNRSTLHWDVISPSDDFDPQTNVDALGNFRWRDNRADPYEWRWVYLGSTPVVTDQTFVLRLWAGSPGYDIDKIVVTDDPRTDWTQIDALSHDYPVGSDNDIGRPATQGSATRAACDPCNPIFGLNVTPEQCTGFSPVLTPTNHLADPLFGSTEPLRTSQEATKRFVQPLDAEFDQVGFVPFTHYIYRDGQAQLECRQRDGEACFDPLVQNPPISYTTMLEKVERSSDALNGTDIAWGMLEGLKALGVNVHDEPLCTSFQNPFDHDCFDNRCTEDHRSGCGQGEAANPILIVLTDGPPNNNPQSEKGVNCSDHPVYNFPPENDDDYDCVIYYAGQALESDVIVYTIGLGDDVPADLLQLAADTGRGRYFFAATPDDLDGVFSEILRTVREKTCGQSLIYLPLILKDS